MKKELYNNLLNIYKNIYKTIDFFTSFLYNGLVCKYKTNKRKGGEKMTKAKYIVGIIVMAIALWIMPNMVHATVDYTRTIPGNDGSIILNLTGLSLEEGQNYSFALVTKGGTPETWHTITEYTQSTAKVHLSAGTSDIVDVLKVTDTGVLYVKKDADNTYVVDGLEVNLKLPYLQAVPYEVQGSYYDVQQLYSSIGDKFSWTHKNTYTQLKKVTDKTLIEKFVQIKNNAGNMTGLESFMTPPTTGYSVNSRVGSSDYDDGLYLIWVKLVGDNCKDVFGCIIHDGLPDATTVAEYIQVQGEGPKVKSIRVVSPSQGTYGAGTKISIYVEFDKAITGTTTPTLKIKFGDGSVRSLTNGLIHNEVAGAFGFHDVTYTYTIQSDDKGQLATVSLEGGTLVDESGNAAILSCPLITGSAIVANGTANNGGTNTSNGSNHNQGGTSTTGKDTTTAPGVIPQTGITCGIITAIAIIAGVAGWTFWRGRKLKGI